MNFGRRAINPMAFEAERLGNVYSELRREKRSTMINVDHANDELD